MSAAARRFLLPLNPAYRLALALRELRLRSGLEAVRRLRWPVVSVGGLSAGGAGKTPMTIALAKALVTAGFGVDVLSRGYGRTSRDAERVRSDGTAEEFGDEPLLIAQEAEVPVFVAARRFDAGEMAESDGKRTDAQTTSPSGADAPVVEQTAMYRLEPVPFGPQPAPFDNTAGGGMRSQVHILDDGFQHRRLHRDIDILLVSGADWRGSLLPAGNLREPRSAIRRAHVIAIPAEEPELESELRAWGWQGPVWLARRVVDIPAVDGPVTAFCGIARADQFFNGLERAGLRLVARAAFRDHHAYTASDIERLVATAHAAGAVALITTEKDRVRLGSLVAPIPESLPLMTAGLRIELEDEAVEWLVQRVREITS